MTNLVSQLVGALNRLYVAAPTGLECNSFHHSKGEFHSHSEPCKPAAEYVEALAQARAALTAAKAGGWLPMGNGFWLSFARAVEAHHGITQRADGGVMQA